jgi:hypothetical protein
MVSNRFIDRPINSYRTMLKDKTNTCALKTAWPDALNEDTAFRNLLWDMINLFCAIKYYAAATAEASR